MGFTHWRRSKKPSTKFDCIFEMIVGLFVVALGLFLPFSFIEEPGDLPIWFFIIYVLLIVIFCVYLILCGFGVFRLGVDNWNELKKVQNGK